MKLKVQHVMDAMLVVSQIIREQGQGLRPMPQKGKYRLARMHAKLLPEFTTINARRDEMITAYGYHPMVQVPAAPGAEKGEIELRTSENFAVPEDKMAEFTAAWKEIGAEEIEVDVEPIPMHQMDLGDNTDGSLSAHEIITLGDLVTGE